MNKKGYSLIELLIVVAVIGILAAVAIPAYVGHKARAARSEAFTNLENLRLLEEQWFADSGEYYPNDGSTKTYSWNGGAGEKLFPGFQPGPAADLNYSYTITGNGANFTATATAKPTSPSHADQPWTINQDNVRNGW